MILTRAEILQELQNGRLVIEPFRESCLEPNSYGFHLNDTILEYCPAQYLDPMKPPRYTEHAFSKDGFLFLPGRFYLCSTLERMGSAHYAATLHANLSVASLGVWIQFSAPLGHMGAVINWTLEIQVAAPVYLYPGMCIGKLAFWKTLGKPAPYNGRYKFSTTTVPSKIANDFEVKNVRTAENSFKNDLLYR